MENIKAVVVGDSGVGKTALVLRFTTNTFPDTSIPTVMDIHADRTNLSTGETVEIELYDTGGEEEDPKLRYLRFHQANVFLICVSVTSPDSFKRIQDYWVPELQKFSPGAPVVLVGTKADLRDDPKTIETLNQPGSKMVSSDEMAELGKEIGAVGVLECSALTGNRVTEVFDSAFCAGLKWDPVSREMKSNSCVLL
eukprot:TRINITY_DN47269_c0_g1_i2.p1 TRINITY_DN47269_c0_g1~~TRINITY_DN47269_c0_g1_i2.p1  ORF type:complete len:196 (+),score=36.15 TRINITY_DN47269_c0_g1_i2:43-630(+)